MLPFFLANFIHLLFTSAKTEDSLKRDRRSSDQKSENSGTFSVFAVTLLFTVGLIGELIGQISVESKWLNPNVQCVFFDKDKGELSYDCKNLNIIDQSPIPLTYRRVRETSFTNVFANWEFFDAVMSRYCQNKIGKISTVGEFNESSYRKSSKEYKYKCLQGAPRYFISMNNVMNYINKCAYLNISQQTSFNIDTSEYISNQIDYIYYDFKNQIYSKEAFNNELTQLSNKADLVASLFSASIFTFISCLIISLRSTISRWRGPAYLPFSYYHGQLSFTRSLSTTMVIILTAIGLLKSWVFLQEQHSNRVFGYFLTGIYNETPHRQ